MLWRAALIATVVLVGCGPYSVFIPYDPAPSKVAGPPKPHAGVALAAVEVFEADVAYLDKTGGVRIGDVSGNTSENGLCQAARNGGTHVVRRSTFRKVLEGSSVTTPGRNFLGQPDGSHNTSTRAVESEEETQRGPCTRAPTRGLPTASRTSSRRATCCRSS